MCVCVCVCVCVTYELMPQDCVLSGDESGSGALKIVYCLEMNQVAEP